MVKKKILPPIFVRTDNVVMANEGRSRGDPQEWWFKILAGLLIFLLLLALLFFPLLFFSNLNPNYHDNPVNTLQLSLGSFFQPPRLHFSFLL